ncbi:GDSL-type esterase/lipase family protein [Duganella margarita]|uniref:GDSL-type esterase/lipase family protein n=1 Tax=Duganella margarita TaxID=2692170 RepID=UPI001926B884|nr:GDSL-type esterase/lipase family protein [Duganella margarita]
MNIRLAATLAVLSTSAFAAAPNDLNVYAGQPLASGRIVVSDSDSVKTMTGAAATIPKADNGVVAVSKSAKAKKDDALTLNFNKAWYASLRVQGGQPVDLRPYLDKGVLALDLKVEELAEGGLSFRVKCGEQCERGVPYVIPARAAQGKGWQHLVMSASCFYRDGDDFSQISQPFELNGTGKGKVAIANVKYQLSGTPNVLCPDYKTVSVTPEKLNESWSISWWTARHEKKLAEAKQVGKSAQVVFIGDSITEGWEKSGVPVWDRYYKPLNGIALGFGGDRTENVLWRLQHGEVDGLAPKVAVLMFGTNNTGHRQEDPKTTALGIKRNIEELQQRLPDTKILLLAIFPRGEKPDDNLRQLNDKVNAVIAGYADNQKVFFLDIGKAFLQADGTLSRDIMPDLLHPNEKGYEIWAKAMAPTLQQLLPGAEKYAWDNVSIGGSGFVSGLITSKTEPGLIYARTDVGGAYRWDVKKNAGFR